MIFCCNIFVLTFYRNKFRLLESFLDKDSCSLVSFFQVCFEKRLVVAHDLNHPHGDAKRTAYGELGEIHAMLGNYEQAISCMEHQLQDAR